MAFTARVVASGLAVASVIAVVAACDSPHDRWRGDCDYVDTQCRSVCDYTCDFYSCYPICWNQCWDECRYDHRHYPSSSSSSSSGDVMPVIDAAAPPVVIDPGSSSGGTGVLCTACSANSDCETDALCIIRGGVVRDTGAADAGPIGRGFCGHSCGTSADCPTGFLCSQLGSNRQCLPTAGHCE